ncbi:hypothetical protein [Rhodosalinus halophilus]|uniref:hypothetical protein n=1 Tax=Rhodosalinus halophilus TaxID=2259333 RepID=UPI0011BE49D4|nr:hypothetical protein [Rhodosalinus halophilus]
MAYSSMQQQERVRNGIAAGLGALIALPSVTYLLLLILLFPRFMQARPLMKVNSSNLKLIYFLILSLAACSLGVLAGNSEAEKYALRIGVCIFGALLVFLTAHRQSISTLKIFLRFMIIAALINSVVVIITAISPDIYLSLRISDFSGFDKTPRPFRSPGLFRGYDTSGAFMCIALAATPVILRPTSNKNYITIIAISLLSLACMLSSRTSMLIFLMTALICATFYRGNHLRAYRLFLLITAVIFAAISLYIISISLFNLSIFTPPQILQEFVPRNISLYYNVGTNDYLRHHRILDIDLFPSETSFLPDNFFSRAGLSLGAVGLIGALIPIIYMSASMLIAYRGNLRYFCLALIFILFAMNFKNNYFFFLPFFTIFCFTFATRPFKPSSG